MKDKKKCIGALIVAALAGVSAVFYAVKGDVPQWLPTITGIISTLCASYGITLVFPTGSNCDSNDKKLD